MTIHRFTVQATERLTPTILLLTLKNADSAHPFSFQAGQYASISFWRHGRPTPARCFSLVSSPTRPDTVQFALRIKGSFTQSIQELAVGDRVVVEGPFGSFTFDQDRDRKAVFLAGGIGITPLMSMLRAATALHLPNQITLLYSVQSQEEAAFSPDLQELQAQNPNIRVYFSIGQRITPELLDTVTGGAYTQYSFFICGPPGFMQGMTGILLGKGAPPESVFTEAFSQGPNRQSGLWMAWPTRVYALSVLGVLLGAGLITSSDLTKHALATAASAQAASAAQTVSATPIPTPDNSATAAPGSYYSATPTPIPTPVPVTTYQPPVSRVS